MDTNRIRQFCVIAELENIRKASEMLYITHSALSKSMKVLEEELGKDLFTKVGRAIALTDEGRKFYPKAKRFLEQVDELISNKEESSDKIKIASFEVFSTYFFTKYLFNEFPQIEFSVNEATPGKLEQLLVSKEVDFGITYQPIPTQELEIIKAGQCEISIFHNNNDFKQMSFEEIPFVAPVTDVKTTISEVRGLDGWPDHQIKRKIKYRVDMLESALQLCSQGHCCGYFPNFVVSLFNESRLKKYHLTTLKAPAKLKSQKKDIYIVKRKSTQSEEIINKLKAIIKSIK